MKFSIWNVVKALLSIAIVFPIIWTSSMFWAIFLPSRSNPGSDLIIISRVYWPSVWFMSAILLILSWFIIWKFRIKKNNKIPKEGSAR